MSEILQHFHFLRPAWLLALPLGWFLLWRWREQLSSNPWSQVIDAELLPHLLAQAPGKASRLPLWLSAVIFTLALLALAGPAWQQLPQPVYAAPTHRVIVMDLSEPMLAADLKPNRLQRAKLITQQLIRQQSEGDIALVSFAADAFAVVPLTNDDATVSHLLDSLQPDLMPRQGQNLAAGINTAVELLDNAKAQTADILILTASPSNAAAENAIRSARSKGYRAHVLAAGTSAGAPVPSGQGAWHKNASGGIRLSRIDEAALRSLASLGGGRYARLDQVGPDWQLAPLNKLTTLSQQQGDEFQADLWQDEGIWLLLPVLLLSAFGFRRGWLLSLCVCLPLWQPQAAYAGWWQTADQEAYAQFQAGDAASAAASFRSREWQASALYEAGEFAEAAQLWQQGESAQDAYNSGNALAKAGDLEAALSAYEKALQRDPELSDAQANYELLKQLLEQQEQDQQQQQDGDSSEDSQQDSAEDSSSQDSSEQDSNSQQQANSDSQNSEQQEQQSSSEQQQAENSEASDQQDESPAQPEEGKESEDAQQAEANQAEMAQDQQSQEQSQAVQQWLNRIPDDPGGLLREKFRRMQQRREASGEDTGTW